MVTPIPLIAIRLADAAAPAEGLDRDGAAASNIIPFVRPPRRDAEHSDARTILPAVERPVPQTPKDKRRGRLVVILIASLLLHAALFAFLHSATEPLPAVELPAISVELIIGDKARPDAGPTAPQAEPKQPAAEEPEQPVAEEPKPPVMEEPKPPVAEEAKPPVTEEPKPPPEEPKPPVAEEPKPPVAEEAKPPPPEEPKPPVAEEPKPPVAEEAKPPAPEEPKPVEEAAPAKAEEPPPPQQEAPPAPEPQPPPTPIEPPPPPVTAVKPPEAPPMPEQARPARPPEERHEPPPAPPAKQKEPARELKRRVEAPVGKRTPAERASQPAETRQRGSREGSAPRTDPNYPGTVFARLARAQHYPAAALANHSQGVATVSFVISASGAVTSVRLARSSGVASLDQEAEAMPRRASPFPPPPGGRAMTITAPVSFHVR